MSNRLLFLLAAPAVFLPGQALAQFSSGYQYERSVVGPGGGVAVTRQSSVSVGGPFGAAHRVAQSGTFVSPTGGTVQYSERSGSVVGPLGGVQTGSTTFVHRASYSSVGVGPVGGVAVSQTTTAAAGPFGPAYISPEAPPASAASYHYERSVVGPGGGVSVMQHSSVAVGGPFVPAFTAPRAGSAIAPNWATVESSERSATVVGPLGGVRSASASYLHAETADAKLSYSRYSRSSSVGPVGGVAVSRTTAAFGPFGVGGVIIRP
jgi:hypothetical protein